MGWELGGREVFEEFWEWVYNLEDDEHKYGSGYHEYRDCGGTDEHRGEDEYDEYNCKDECDRENGCEGKGKRHCGRDKDND